MLVAALATQVAGCGLLLDLDPPDGARLECFVTLRSADGEEIEVSSLMTPELMGRDFFVCIGGPCPPGCDRDEITDSMGDWHDWVAHRVAEVAAISDPSDPLFSSDFRTRPGPWCQVPGTLRCESRGAPTSSLACPPAIPAATLPGCSGPPPPSPPPGGDPCLTVDCGATPCSEILFGDVPVGGSVGAPVRVTNCGEVPVRLQIDGSVLPIPPRSDFEMPVATNLCVARNLDEERRGRPLQPLAVDPAEASCSFEVMFRPLEPLSHRALIRFWSEVDPRHEIRLGGNALGGSIAVDAPETMCLSTMTGPCTPTRTIGITNDGPGDVTIREIRIEPTPGAGFEIVAPPPPPLPTTLRRGDTLEVRIRWCGPPLATAVAILVIETDAPAEPTVTIPLTRTTGRCPPGT